VCARGGTLKYSNGALLVGALAAPTHAPCMAQPDALRAHGEVARWWALPILASFARGLAPTSADETPGVVARSVNMGDAFPLRRSARVTLAAHAARAQ